MAENKYLEFIKNTKDVEKALIKGTQDAFFMQFSNMRKNILDWYEFQPDMEVLEIGAGCGTITSMLCNRCKRVVAVDTSQEFCEVNEYRNQQFSNLTVRCGAVGCVDDSEKFDLVIVIGGFCKSEIHALKNHLKPDGKLIIAVDNKYGLKYFSGASDEYSGNCFSFLEEESVPDGVYTKGELEAILKNAGFTDLACYYPIPDFRMMREIYSEDFLPRKGLMTTISPSYKEPRVLTFNEVKAFDQVCEDGYIKEFANAFLYIASCEQ